MAREVYEPFVSATECKYQTSFKQPGRLHEAPVLEILRAEPIEREDDSLSILKPPKECQCLRMEPAPRVLPDCSLSRRKCPEKRLASSTEAAGTPPPNIRKAETTGDSYVDAKPIMKSGKVRSCRLAPQPSSLPERMEEPARVF